MQVPLREHSSCITQRGQYSPWRAQSVWSDGQLSVTIERTHVFPKEGTVVSLVPRSHQFSLPCFRVVTTLECLGPLHNVLWQLEVPQPVFPLIHGLSQETDTFCETDWESGDRRLLASLEVFNCPLWNSLPMRDTATELISIMLDWAISGSSSQGSPPPSFQKCFHLNVNLALCLKPDSSVSGLWHTWEFKLDR